MLKDLLKAAVLPGAAALTGAAGAAMLLVTGFSL